MAFLATSATFDMPQRAIRRIEPSQGTAFVSDARQAAVRRMARLLALPAAGAVAAQGVGAVGTQTPRLAACPVPV